MSQKKWNKFSEENNNKADYSKRIMSKILIISITI